MGSKRLNLKKTELLTVVFATLFACVLATVNGAPSIICDVPSATHLNIQSAVNDASCETINLVGSTYSENVTVGRSVLIQGQGYANTEVDGGEAGSVFTVQVAVDVTLAGITAINGRSETGAGIYNLGGNLTIRDSAIISNTVVFVSGGNSSGGGIYNAAGGTVTIVDSLVGFNSGWVSGGGLSNSGVATVSGSTFLDNGAMGGGGIANSGTMNISQSLLTQNGATDGGGISNSGSLTVIDSLLELNEGGRDAGGILNFGQLAVTNSTIRQNLANVELGGGIKNWAGSITVDGVTLSGNMANLDGGGIYNGGGGIVNVANSTVSGNSAGRYGGGLFNGTSGTFGLKNITIVNNGATGGGSIYNGDAVNVINSIMANTSSGDNCQGTAVTSGGHNLASDLSCSLSGPGDLSNVDPVLDVLAGNGGATNTHALLSGSPAIDAADDDACLPADQRGFSRPVDGDQDGFSHCDMGAYELYSTRIFLPFTMSTS